MVVFLLESIKNCLTWQYLFTFQEHLDSTHGSVHSLDADLLLPSGDPFSKSDNDMFKEGLRRAQSTDSLGTSGSLQSKALGYNYKAKSAGNLDESDFGPLVGADSVSENFDTASLGSLQMPSGFMLTKDQERAIKAMTPEQEETASLLSSVTQGVESAYVSPSGYRLVSETEWNLLQKEVSYLPEFSSCSLSGMLGSPGFIVHSRDGVSVCTCCQQVDVNAYCLTLVVFGSG